MALMGPRKAPVAWAGILALVCSVLPSFPGQEWLVASVALACLGASSRKQGLILILMGWTGLGILGSRGLADWGNLFVLALVVGAFAVGGLWSLRLKEEREQRYREEYLTRKKDFDGVESELEAVNKRHGELEEHLSHTSRMYEGVRRLLEEKLSRDDVMTLATDLVERVGEQENFCFLVPRDGKQGLEARHAHGQLAGGFKGAAMRASSGSLVRALWDSEDPRLYKDMAAEPLFRGFAKPKAFGSLATIPLRASGNTLALLLSFSAKPGGISAESYGRLSALKDHLALGLQKAQLYSDVERLSTVDGLTTLSTRRHFLQRLEEELERARRYGYPVSVILGDLDFFKKVNDRHGHPVGDDVLKRMGFILSGEIRPPSVAARFGGEEFIAMLPKATGEEAAETAERIRNEISALPMTSVPEGDSEHNVNITASFGVAVFPKQAGNSQDLIEAADKALYAAKEGGRDKVVWADS